MKHPLNEKDRKVGDEGMKTEQETKFIIIEWMKLICLIVWQSKEDTLTYTLTQLVLGKKNEQAIKKNNKRVSGVGGWKLNERVSLL